MTQAVQIKSAQTAKAGSKKLKTGKELKAGAAGASAKNRFTETRLFEKFLRHAGKADGKQSTVVNRAAAKPSKLLEEAVSDPKTGTAKKEEKLLLKEKLSAANMEKERKGKKAQGEDDNALLSALATQVPALQTPETKIADGDSDLQVKGAGQKGTAAAEKLSTFAAKAAAKEDGGTDKPQRMIQVFASAPQAEAGRSAKRTDKKEEAKKATVVDLRKPQAKEQGDANAVGFQPQGLEAEASGERAETEGDGLSFDLLKSQSGKSAEAAAKQADKQTSFASTLDEVMKNHIVKQTGIILKNETAGEIRLTLKPEHLGKVRIRIELEDMHVAGKIFVENETVRNIFEQNMNELSKAFAEGGFQLGSLDVSVGEKRGGGGNPANKSQGNALRAIASLEEHVPSVSDSFAVPGLGDERIVNLYV